MDKQLNVFYFSSDHFVSVAATSIVSLLENNTEFESITIYYVDDGISSMNKDKLIQLVKRYNREILFIVAPDPSEMFDFPFKEKYQMGHSYMRMGVGSLLPSHVKKVLCLDSDTLVTGNLLELWNVDLGEDILAGVSDCLNIPKYKHRFFLNDKDIYCNAGVFLVDLEKWRAFNIERIISEKIKERNGNVFFFEQTLMNYACKGKIYKLHPKYNCYTLFFAFTYKNLMRWRKPTDFYTEREVDEAKDKPVIVHFTRNFYMLSRPWVKNCDHPMCDEYQKYKQMTLYGLVWAKTIGHAGKLVNIDCYIYCRKALLQHL